ncbi:MAG: cysteine hydrolase [Clostridia bacterium]|nr:cysteine hydrolase [Clostridia bacterium]
MVLLVVDAQKLITTDKLYNFEAFCHNVKRLIHTARQNRIEVIYIRHDDGAGQALTKGADGYEIYDEFKPADGEKIFDKTVNSPFKDSGLLSYLKDKGETTVIITGLQTDYCIDASVKCAFEHGFDVIVPAFANTTVDNPFLSGEESYNYYNNFIWNGRYAKSISTDDTIKLMTNGN